jgi:hypothetical protein
MSATTHALADEVTLENLGPRTLTALAGFYSHLLPEKDVNTFMQDILVPMGANSSITGNSYLEEFKAAHLSESADLRFGPMLISCAYCVEAMRYLSDSQRELAWLRMVEARFWCGVTLASKGIEVAREQTISATRRNTSRKGGNARDAINYQETREEAYRLARASRPKENGWRSRRQAVFGIIDDVKKFSANQPLPLKENQAEKTIDGWLAAMPDAKELFTRRQIKKVR